MVISILLALVFALTSQQPPQPVGTSPSACLKEVRDYAATRRSEVPPPPAPTGAADPAAQAAAAQQRTQLLRQIDADRLTMAKACAARFDVKTAADGTLADLASLYTEAALPDLAKAALDRALLAKTLPEPDRAAVLVQAIQAGLREPITAERNARLETLSDRLDKFSSAAIEQKFSAHTSLNGYYRYDDLDAGIIKHSTWMIEAMKTLTPDQRRKFGSAAVGAYVNMAEAWAGQGMNDKALDLLRRAPKELPDVPGAAARVQEEIGRLELVGTAGAPITAAHWLNMPAGASLDLKGKVTLLEFSAHWCQPCRESYPGVNRLRAKYGPQGFQVVLATQFYGYFQTERPLTPEVEFERDRAYFAEHGLDVPIAVGDAMTRTAPNPNDAAYKVGGIPQIHLIDKQGRIRLVMVGYDDANEAKLATMIETMLKEK
jgi:thiol-disulfide isomerase/thioredoxin